MKAKMILGMLTALVVTSAQAVPVPFVDFGIVPFGGAPSYTGATLQTSTAFFPDGAFLLVNQIGPGDQSGLSVGDFATLSPIIPYGPGLTGPTDFYKTWDGQFGPFSEHLVAFVADRTRVNSITIDFYGTMTAPGGATSPVELILSANQAGGPGHQINWAVTDTSLSGGLHPTPLPGALVMFGTVIAGAGALMRRRKIKSVQAV